MRIEASPIQAATGHLHPTTLRVHRFHLCHKTPIQHSKLAESASATIIGPVNPAMSGTGHAVQHA